jgi:hypothetical protein
MFRSYAHEREVLVKICFFLLMAMLLACMSLSTVGDACAQIVAILLVHVSILACCSALCIFEKHMLAFVDLIHALPTRGELCLQFMGRDAPFLIRGGGVLHHGGEKDGYSVQGENLSLHAFVQGELAFKLWELFVLPESCFVLCSFVNGVEPFCLCRMDLPGPTTSMGTRTDYSVGPWDYPACATWYLMAWSTRTTQE